LNGEVIWQAIVTAKQVFLKSVPGEPLQDGAGLLRELLESFFSRNLRHFRHLLLVKFLIFVIKYTVACFQKLSAPKSICYKQEKPSRVNLITNVFFGAV